MPEKDEEKVPLLGDEDAGPSTVRDGWWRKNTPLKYDSIDSELKTEPKMHSEVNGRYSTKSEPISQEKSNEPFNEELFRQVYQYEPAPEESWKTKLKKEALCSTRTLLNLFPILKWLPQYKKSDILNDLTAGLTIAVMNIPQGMAYALLGGCPPIVGIYMAIFPVAVYIIMGTSRHVSMGTFAVVCMMVGKCVASFPLNDPVEVATAVCFTVGLWQVLLSILKLGSLSVLLSETLVSGFTTGAAVHVLTSQVKNLLGLKLPRHTGPMKIIYTYVDIFSNLQEVNLTDVLLSICFISFLLTFNEVVKPWIQKKAKRAVPLPIELLVVILGTAISVQLGLKANYNVAIVGEVPTGLPTPKPPPMHLISDLAVDGLIIAIVAISINISMATIFAKKLNYEISGNQEILASGVGNIVGSFFSCMPFSASLSRSLIQESVGGRTQIAGVVSACLLILVLLFIGPFFEPLPYCVLSTIIVVSLKGMFMQFKDLPKTYKQSKLDGMVWIVAFISVVGLDIDYGLGFGLAASVATMVIRNQSPEVLIIGQVPGTSVYLDTTRFKKAKHLPNILILQIIGGLHFANCESVRKTITGHFMDFQNKQSIIILATEKPARHLTVVINLVSVPYMDPSAVKGLFALYADLRKLGVDLMLCECTPSVYETLNHAEAFFDYPKSFLFPSVHDAIEFVQKLG